jgi:saccharopepsin
MSIEGIWVNEYGSVMELRQKKDGRLFGSYSSTTGSTGTYYVLGWADPRDPNPARGQSLALSVLWRSIGDESPDPSWHWVSGHGGQILGGSGPRRLLLMHDMVATAPFPGQAGIGRHIDKLIFASTPGAKAPTAVPGDEPVAAEELIAAEGLALPCRLSGSWVDSNDPSIKLDIRLLDARFGFAMAALTLDGKGCEAQGFIDPYAEAGGCGIQALSLTGLLDRESGETISLSGGLDLNRGAVELTVFRNHGTSAEFSYTQTLVDQFRLVKAKR